MAPNPLDILKKGLAQFSKKKERISPEDEQWLDEEENTADEQQILDMLEAASDYERGITRLDERLKGIVKKLGKWAGDLKEARQKQKHKINSQAPMKKSVLLPPAPVFTKKENATLAQRIEILDWHNKNGKNQSKTTQHFAAIYPNLKIKQPLISSWVKDESNWRSQWNDANRANEKTAKRVQQTEHPEISKMMDLWITRALADGILLTGEVLCQKWNQFADLVGIPEEDRLKLSEGWLTQFKERNGLRQVKRHSKAASATEDNVENERV
ncbi:hypothetical protein BYT27DRAFT_7251638 [Phlegmacium glaucopus]|nr:hypothetical protein BYT27DRAFT_7251638 [Phlegmacium glaucopus]